MYEVMDAIGDRLVHRRQGGALLFTDRQILFRSVAATDQPSHYFATVQQFDCQVNVVPRVDGQGYTLTAAIPWAALNVKPQVEAELRFDLGVNVSASGTRRLRQIMWNGTNRNSGDRTAWGWVVRAQ